MPGNINRRHFLAGTALGLAAAPTAAPQTGPSARPNVVLIMTDQQSNSALGANGNPYLKTPAMDSLVAEGVSFLQSYCTYPVCSPARSSIMTGRMPHETGVRKNGQPIVEGMVTMGEHFRANGYETHYAGKWHIPQGFGKPPGFNHLIGGHSLGANMDEPLATECVRFLTGNPTEPFLLVLPGNLWVSELARGTDVRGSGGTCDRWIQRIVDLLPSRSGRAGGHLGSAHQR